MPDKECAALMLVIRKEQQDLLSLHMVDCFRDETARFLRACFPTELSQTSEAELFAWIGEEVRLAARWGIEMAHDLRLWLCVGVVLGRNFLSEPKYAWAAA